MYNYKFNYDEEIYEIHKKALKKIIAPTALTLIGLLDIFIIIAVGVLFCISYKMTFSQYASIMISVLVVQIIVATILYRKIISASLEAIKDRNTVATFDEEGFKYYNDNTIRITKWSGIKSVRALDDSIIVQDSVNGFPINIMAFKNFDGTKEDLIVAIEKYTKVRRM